MSLEKINGGFKGNNKNAFIDQITNSKELVNSLLEDKKQQIINKLKEIEKKEKGFKFNQETLDAIFIKYPNISIEEFEGYFLSGTYNKNILMCSPEIISLLNLDEINIGDDLIEYIIKKISIPKEVFEEKVLGKIDILTFPNLAVGDVAQGYFYKKLIDLLSSTKIIFGDMPEIRENFGKNQFNCDSVGFIDLMGNGLFNTCLLKLLKTQPDNTKIKELNKVFSQVQKDIFIGGSTFNIPFKLPKNFLGISMPKTPINGLPLTLKNSILLNSMGYLNSAYYAEKTKASFVLGSHNIAEPMHAGKLTVINNDPTNRYNHNWLISYFGEKAKLLLYMEGNEEQNQKEIDNFLEIPKENLEKRYKHFQEIYKSEIIPLIYGIFYNFLRKNFPEKIT